MNTRYRMARWLLAAICACGLWRDLSAATGEDVYARHCARCHEQATDRVPPRAALAQLSPRT